MELVWHDCKTCPPQEKYNERLFISAGFQVIPVVWMNGKFYHKSGPSEGKEVDLSASCVYWADIDYTTTKFFGRTDAPKKKWHYCVNTVSKNDNPVSWGHWMFGHYHADRIEYPHVEQFFNEYEDMNTIVERWKKFDETGHLDWWLPKSPRFDN